MSFCFSINLHIALIRITWAPLLTQRLLSLLFLFLWYIFRSGFFSAFWFCAFILSLLFPLSHFLLTTDKSVLHTLVTSGPLTSTVPRLKIAAVATIRFLIRNKSRLLAGSLVKVFSGWVLHSHMKAEWRFRPPTTHCSSCPLPFLSNLGTQETAEHVLNSTLGSHGSISLDSSYPWVVFFLWLTWVMPGLFFAMTPPHLALLTSLGWDGYLQPLGRGSECGQVQGTWGMGHDSTASVTGSENMEKMKFTSRVLDVKC